MVGLVWDFNGGKYFRTIVAEKVDCHWFRSMLVFNKSGLTVVSRHLDNVYISFFLSILSFSIFPEDVSTTGMSGFSITPHELGTKWPRN